ncbi:hypothetical protein CLU79DRAFT_744615 [Phycomyces nitens]|nr:hypothetical protein CLU79DRAFT_744615 [Phycomyces nitens]
MPSFSFLPYSLLASSGSIAQPGTSTFYADIMLQFTKQVMRPRVLLPMVIVIVLLFDLDDTFDLDDAYFDLEDEEDFKYQAIILIIIIVFYYCLYIVSVFLGFQ